MRIPDQRMQRCCIIHDCYVGGIFLGSVQAYIPIQRCRHVDLLNSEFFVPLITLCLAVNNMC